MAQIVRTIQNSKILLKSYFGRCCRKDKRPSHCMWGTAQGSAVGVEAKEVGHGGGKQPSGCWGKEEKDVFVWYCGRHLAVSHLCGCFGCGDRIRATRGHLWCRWRHKRLDGVFTVVRAFVHVVHMLCFAQHISLGFIVVSSGVFGIMSRVSVPFSFLQCLQCFPLCTRQCGVSDCLSGVSSRVYGVPSGVFVFRPVLWGFCIYHPCYIVAKGQ